MENQEEKKIKQALKYAEATSSIENMNPTKEELKKIKSMLENNSKQQKEEKKHGKTK